MMKNPLFEKGWLFVFSLLFFLKLSKRIESFPLRASKNWDVTHDYGITEWMINYQAGFVRRGLPGSFLHWLYERLGVAPDVSAIAISAIFFIVVCCYLIYRSRSLLPTWVMLTTPLLGYMIYMEDSLVRKDSLTLLLLAISFRIFCANDFRLWFAIPLIITSVFAVLSHEVFSVLFIPASIFILTLSHLSRPQLIQTHLIKAACLLPAGVATLAVTSFRGSVAQALKIKSSWQLFFASHPNPEQIGGSIGWLQRDSADGAAYVNEFFRHQIFNSRYFSIDYGPAAILLLLLATFLIFVMIRRSDMRLFFFVVVIIQIVAMLPIFLHALDYGRWVALCLNSALIITMESTTSCRNTLEKLLPFPRFFNAWGLVNSVPFLCVVVPIALGFWGLPHVGWYNWLLTSPFGSVLSPLGVPGPLRTLKILMRWI